MPDGGTVAATVDWRADLVAVDIRTALTRTRGTDLASPVVEAVNRARAEANAELMRALPTGQGRRERKGERRKSLRRS